MLSLKKLFRLSAHLQTKWWWVQIPLQSSLGFLCYIYFKSFNFTRFSKEEFIYNGFVVHRVSFG